MRTLVSVLGITLIVVGVIALAWQEVTYATHGKILEISPVSATAEREKAVELPPTFGALSLSSGLGLLLVGVRR